MSERVTKSQPRRDLWDLVNCQMLVISGPDKGRSIRLDRDSIIIGNFETCDLVLRDDFVSRKHCEIKRLKDGHQLTDLDSRNGTFVNGLQVKQALLKPGAMLRVGNCDLLYQAQIDEAQLPLSGAKQFGEVLGFSRAMRQLYTVLETVAPSNLSILIEGESGTGKELLAQSIHRESKRADKPLVVVDCGAIPENLIESHLFGHEKGAFTGADERKIGAFENAQGGTIFLDEIGELPLHLQPKLLRVLEERQIRRVGGLEPIKVDVRVLAATNRQLDAEIKAGRFREDLFYRLAVLRVKVPTLRERREDIPLLVEHYLAKQPDGKPVKSISPEAMARLVEYDWPGNVRELRNVIERAMHLGESARLEMTDLHLPARAAGAPALALVNPTQPQARSMDEIERQGIIETLKAVNWKKTEAAKRLGIAYSTFYEKVKKYGIKKE